MNMFYLLRTQRHTIGSQQSYVKQISQSFLITKSTYPK